MTTSDAYVSVVSVRILYHSVATSQVGSSTICQSNGWLAGSCELRVAMEFASVRKRKFGGERWSATVSDRTAEFCEGVATADNGGWNPSWLLRPLEAPGNR